LDALYDGNRNYKKQEVQQTYVVFYKQYNGKTYKFISQATTQNADAVNRYIDRQKGIDLYVDPKNPTGYYFDLPYA
jgi:histidinol-phosphate/aromatic aminotransferase/cobyric acid decarboxylase-like protein